MIYLGDIGTTIIVDTGIDLTGATTLELKVQKPSGAESTWTATIADGYTAPDGLLQYVTQSGDLDEVGSWKLQAHRIATGVNHLGDTAQFEVRDVYR